MTAPRFEIVRSDAGWHSRFRASNGRIIFSSEVYTRRRAAVNAIDTLARLFSPTSQVWPSTVKQGGVTSTDLRYGSEGHSTYLNAHRVEVRDIDAREATS